MSSSWENSAQHFEGSQANAIRNMIKGMPLIYWQTPTTLLDTGSITTEIWNALPVKDYSAAMIEAKVQALATFGSQENGNISLELIFPLDTTANIDSNWNPLVAYPLARTKDFTGLFLNGAGNGRVVVLSGCWQGIVPIIGKHIYWQLKRRFYGGNPIGEVPLSTPGYAVSNISARINLLGYIRR